MQFSLNYSGTRFLSTKNPNYSISWWILSLVFLAAVLSVMACNTPLPVMGEAALHEDTNTAGQETIWYSQAINNLSHSLLELRFVTWRWVTPVS